MAIALALPFSPAAPFFGFVPLPPLLLAIVAALVLAYLGLAEACKRYLYGAHGAWRDRQPWAGG